MVYIPPVKNSQIDQYAERDVINKDAPFHVSPLIKTNATSSHNQVSGESPLKKSIKRKRTKLKKTGSSTTEQAISEITGKGRNFNERI